MCRHRHLFRLSLIRCQKSEAMRTASKYGKNWLGLRHRVLVRDNFACTQCGSKTDLHVHHCIPLSRGGVNAMYNLTTLCLVCHSHKPFHHKVTKKRKYDTSGDSFSAPSNPFARQQDNCEFSARKRKMWFAKNSQR